MIEGRKGFDAAGGNQSAVTHRAQGPKTEQAIGVAQSGIRKSGIQQEKFKRLKRKKKDASHGDGESKTALSIFVDDRRVLDKARPEEKKIRRRGLSLAAGKRVQPNDAGQEKGNFLARRGTS